MTNKNFKPWLSKTILTGTIVLSILLISAVGYTCYKSYTQPEIAFVRTLELVYGYNGMKQAHDEFQAQSQQWQANIDTLNNRYRERVAEYKATENKSTKAEKNEREEQIKRLESDIKKYTAAIRQKAEEKDAKITEGILLQIDAFIEKYAKEKGYDIVLGAQGDGNVMYGTKQYDITEDILLELNRDYKYIPQNSSMKQTE